MSSITGPLAVAAAEAAVADGPPRNPTRRDVGHYLRLERGQVE